MKRISYRDILLAFHEGGLKGLDCLLEGQKVSRRTLLRAAAGTSDEHVKEFLLEYTDQRVPTEGKKPRPPRSGEIRSYLVQKRGGPHMRLPLNTLGVEPGERVQVEFEDEKIIVTKGDKDD